MGSSLMKERRGKELPWREQWRKDKEKVRGSASDRLRRLETQSQPRIETVNAVEQERNKKEEKMKRKEKEKKK